MRIFLAGATGAIGRRLVPILLEAGHQVTGTTRSEEKARTLTEQGVTPVVLDVFNADALTQAVVGARPEVLIHQLTDLPQVNDPAAMAAARVRNARLREETAPTLLRAAQAAGVRRVIVQSICFAYAEGRRPYAETDPIASPSVQVMETTTLNTAGVEGVVLRYGQLWGPGTWAEKPTSPPTLHVDAAAQAALVAITLGAPGIYNIAEENAVVSTEKARRLLKL